MTCPTKQACFNTHGNHTHPTLPSDLVSRTSVTSSAVSSVKNEGPFKRAVLPARNSGGWAGVVAGKEKSVASTTTSQSSERRPRKVKPVANFE